MNEETLNVLSNYKEIIDIVNQIENLFVYKNDILEYDEQTQEKISDLLKELCELLGVFKKTSENEEENISSDLYYIENGKKKILVNIETMAERVRTVLEKNNIFTCLKSLALSNKCAHSFEYKSDKKSEENNISNFFAKNFSDDPKKEYSFLVNFEDLFKNITLDSDMVNKVKNLSTKKKNMFDYYEKKVKIWLNISDTQLKNVNNIDKIGALLRDLGIQVDFRNEAEIIKKFISIRDKLKDSFAYYFYEEGRKLAILQSKLFSIKDHYIGMIGQLLINKTINLNSELVTTPDTKPGFQNMLTIDDPDLSYYIEVHMPDCIAEKLAKLRRKRKFQKLGASAVYYRDKEEVKNIHRNIDRVPTDENNEHVRADIVSRDYPEEAALKAAEESTESQTKDTIPSDHEQITEYTFKTKRIDTGPNTIIESFLIKIGFSHLVKENKIILLNENYSKDYLMNAVCDNYCFMFSKFTESTKMEFIEYAYNALGSKIYSTSALDSIDYNSKFTLDDIGEMIIKQDIIRIPSITLYQAIGGYLHKNQQKEREQYDEKSI